MYPANFEYLRPKGIDDALELLRRYGDDAKLLAGGQSLVPMMKLRVARPKYLIDIHRIADLSYIREDGNELRIGATTRHVEIEESPLIAAKLPMLREAAGEIGDLQVRNRGTIGGGLVEADPCGDYGPVALALNAQLKCIGPRGERVIPAAEFFTFAYTTALEPDEILTDIVFPLPAKDSAGVYVKLEKVAGDFAIASAAVQLSLDGSGACKEIGVGAAGGGTVPQKGATVEALLRGKKIDAGLIEQSGLLIVENAEPIEDMRGSGAYKKKALSAILRRALTEALRRGVGAHGVRTVLAKPRFWIIFAYCFFAASSTFAAQASGQIANFTIAYTSVSPQYAPVWIAKEAGFFRRNGVNAQLVYMRGGVLATQALVSNDVSFINAGGGGVVDAVLGGADIFMIASPINQEPQVLVAKKEIKDIRQLRGKRLAVNSLAGPAMLSLKMILGASGLDPERDVTYLATGPSASRYGALQLGQVEAATLAPPFTFAARKAGYTFFEDLPAMKQAELPNAALATSRKFFDTEPLATEMVVKSVIEGIHFYKTEKRKTSAILKQYMKIADGEELDETYNFYVNLFAEKPYPSTRGVQTILDWSKRADARKASPVQFMQTRFIEKLDKQGFIDGLYKK